MAVEYRGCGKTVTFVENIQDNQRTSKQPAFSFSAHVLAKEIHLDRVPSSASQNKYMGSIM